MTPQTPTENSVAAALRERAEREAERIAAEHQWRMDGLMRGFIKRTVLA